jgi:hypothetical protein
VVNFARVSGCSTEITHSANRDVAGGAGLDGHIEGGLKSHHRVSLQKAFPALQKVKTVGQSVRATLDVEEQTRVKRCLLAMLFK